MWTALLGLTGTAFNVLGGAISGLFGFKGKQGAVLQSALKTLQSVNASDDARAKAVATVIAAESNSDSWITRMWRPLFMTICMSIVVAFWFGISPSGIDQEMSPMMNRIFDLLEIGVLGYIPARTVDKIFKQIEIGKIIKTFINKKIV